MDSNAKSEETISLEVDTVSPPTVTSVPENNENAQNNVSSVESIPIPLDVSHEPVVDEKVEVAVSVAEVVNDISDNCNSAPVEDDKLNKAMASTTLADVKQNPSEAISDEQVSDLIEKENTKENTFVDNMSIKPVVSEEKTSEPNETSDVEFKDALESIDNEDDEVEREQQCDINKQECLPDGESSGEDEIVDEEELGDDGDAEPDTSAPEIPVPVDNDTNDPQYIPRRGRFYEHDDRMAYSTTSSEGSESEDGHEKESGDENEGSVHQRNKKERTDSQNQKSTTKSVNIAENNATVVIDSTPSTKKVLAISKAASVLKDSSDNATASDGSAKKPSGGFRKSRNIDSLDKWSHDMYDEREQTPKSRDELLVSYGYDIREESEAPRARRHHKYGRSATAKYTRNWQDTKAYIGTGGPQSSKVKRGGVAQRLVGGPYKNKNKSSTSNEYTSEFPTLDGKKTIESSTTTVAVTEPSVVTKDLNQHHNQQPKSLSQEKKTVMSVSKTNPTRNHFTRTPIKNVTSGNHSNHQDQKNGGPSQSSFHNKNHFNRSSSNSPANKEKITSQVNRDNSSTAVNPNLFIRKPQQNQPNNFKQQHFNSQGHNQHHSSSAPRGRNFHQHNNTNQQYNHDRYFAKGSGPPLSSNSNYDQQHNSVGPTSAGTGRTRHSGGNYNQYNNRQYDNENDQNEQLSQPVVRSSKRYSVQSRRELPDPVLNFNAMSKTSQSQQSSVSQHQQQQNGLVMQDQQQTIQQLQSQQQPPIQIHQQQPPTMQIQQFHQPIQQIHPHHGMVLDHNTGMMVMATADPSMYHQLYAAPQYATAVTPGPAAVTDDQNAAAVAAAALQMLAAQAAVYQPVPTGATGVTPPTTGTQSMQQQQQPETFMTTYYQPQQQPQQQPPPRRVNLAIPIVAPPPEQGASKTPPPTAA
ncbi:protein CASC3 isoform X2 [Sipha flava]|uniref:Protein CASC3 n=1 Tax=Sipha flava TaxID=143950 RepID=A0A8B8FC83_9HEMI|nr:protein CASC3 isoform X2 [Sipha flava]